MEYDVIAAGSLMTDILAADLPQVSDPTNVTYGETDFREKVGGHPVNICIGLTKIGYNPKKLAVIGVVGGEKDDIFAKFVLDTIISYNLTTKYIKKIPGRRTGKNVILEVRGEDRRFHINSGANQLLNPKYIQEVLKKFKPKIFSARPCYTGMDFHMELIFKAAGKAVKMIDVCKPYKAKWQNILPALQYVDVFHGNDREAKDMTGTDHTEEAIKTIMDYGVKAVFVTKGDQGRAVLVTEKLEISQPCFDAKPYVQKGEAIDATGCGDAFCAGVIYKILEYGSGKEFTNENEEKLVELLMFSQAVGASAATKIGCTEGVSKKTLDAILEDQGNKILNETEVQYKVR